ncbi:stage II sporulation protein M [Chloroflexota bacterium]
MATIAPPGTDLTGTPAGLAARWRNWRIMMSHALIVTRREVTDSFRDWRIMTPIFVLTLLFPAISQFGANLMLNFVTQYGAELIGERTIPFLLMIVGFFPISLSLVIALETFVGEKERRSLEPLLSTPLTNAELYVGKTLAAMLPPLLASYTGMAIYLSGLLFGELAWRPHAMLIIQIILLTTAQALLMVTGAVVVSSQTTSTRAANLLASFIIVPMSLLLILESIVMFGAPDAESPSGILALWAILVGLIIGTIMFMRIGTRLFNREDLLGSTIDMLNLGWVRRTFWQGVRGVDKPGFVTWYRAEVLGAARRLGRPLATILVAAVLAVLAGWGIGTYSSWQFPPEALDAQEAMQANFSSVMDMGRQPGTVLLAVVQNLRVLLVAAILGVISFGVLAIFLAIIPFMILGWSFAQFMLLGLDLNLFFAAVIPHSLVEIPAIFLATAVVLQLGAVVTRKPPPNETVSTLWLAAAADMVKVGLGLVLPLLVIAALIEVYITPLVVQMVLGG